MGVVTLGVSLSAMTASGKGGGGVHTNQMEKNKKFQTFVYSDKGDQSRQLTKTHCPAHHSCTVCASRCII